jgi:hypothetical protein
MRLVSIMIVHDMTSNTEFCFRFIWFIAIVASATYLTITVQREITHYYSNPTRTVTKMDVKSELQFPAVTICNLSPYNKSRIPMDPRRDKYVQDMANHVPVNWSDPVLRDLGFFEPITPEMMMNATMRRSLSIRWGSFDTVGYNVSDIFEYTRAYRGLCYTFNSDGHVHTRFSGSTYNLFISMWIDQDNYINLTEDLSAGIKVSQTNYMYNDIPDSRGKYNISPCPSLPQI